MNTAAEYFYILTCTWAEAGGIRTRTGSGAVTLDGPVSRETVYKTIRANAEKKHGFPPDAPVLFFSLEPAEIGGAR